MMALESSTSNVYGDLSMSGLLEVNDGSSVSSSTESLVRVTFNIPPKRTPFEKNNVDRIEKMVRKYRRCREHRSIMIPDSNLVLQKLKEVYGGSIVWEEAIKSRISLVEFMREMRDFSISFLDTCSHLSEDYTLDSSATSSSIPSSEEESRSESLAVSEKKNSSPELAFDLNRRSPTVFPLNEDEKQFPWGCKMDRQSNDSSTDSLYDIDLSSDATLTSVIKPSKLRRNYYKFNQSYEKDFRNTPNIPEHELNPQQCFDCRANEAVHLVKKGFKIAVEKNNLTELLDKSPLSYKDRKKVDKQIRKRLWEKYVKPIIAKASTELDNLETFPNEETGTSVDADWMQHLDRNLALLAKIPEKKSPQMTFGIVTKDESNTSLGVRRKPTIMTSKNSSSEDFRGKPYHIVCQERARKMASKQKRLMKEAVGDICTSQTFAYYGVRVRQLLRNDLVLPNDEYHKQFTLSQKEKDRLRRLLNE